MQVGKTVSLESGNAICECGSPALFLPAGKGGKDHHGAVCTGDWDGRDSHLSEFGSPYPTDSE